MKSRLLACLLLAGLALLIAGCGSSKKNSSGSKSTVKTVTVSTTPVTAGTGTSTTSTVSAFGTGATQATNLDNLQRPFSANSPWNTPDTSEVTATNSANLMSLAEKRYGVVVSSNSGADSLEDVRTQVRTITAPLYINTHLWTDPIVFTSGTASTVKLECRQVNLPPPNNDCGDGYQISNLNIPVTQYPKPGYDGWLTVIDESTGYAYDFWRARFIQGNTILSYQFVRRWDLNGPGFLAPAYVGARGSGLPMFAGEILPSDIKRGRINHALAIAVPGPASNYYVQPASSTDGNGATNSLPEGARIRLKSTFDIAAALKTLPGSTNLRAARAVMQALKTYGAYVVERAAVPTLYAVPNYNWNRYLRNTSGQLLSPNGRTVLPKAYQNAKKYGTPLLSGGVAQALHLSDFEVVSLPTIHQYPPLPNTTDQGGVNGVAPQSTSGKSTTESSQIGQQSNNASAIAGNLP